MNSEEEQHQQKPFIWRNAFQLLRLTAFTTLINNRQKKITLCAVLFFAFFAQSDLSDLLFEAQDFNKLNVNEGKVKIYKGEGRVRDSLYLVNNNQRILFSCGANACLPTNKIPEYQGKTAKAWW